MSGHETETAILARLEAAERRSAGGERARLSVIPAAPVMVGGAGTGSTNGRAPEVEPFGGRPWMQSFNGHGIPLVRTLPSDIRWADVIHGLAYNNRFAGAAGSYSVAQHSCVVADMLPPEWRAYGLLHDAHEAYIGDITRPVALALDVHDCPDGTGYAITRLKATLDYAIFTKAGLIYPFPSDIAKAVHIADDRAMMTERRDLMVKSPYSWGNYENVVPLPERIERWMPSVAVWEFYDRLTKYVPGV